MFRRNTTLTPLAQQLRTNATREENHLWYDFLKSHPISFRRQMILNRFIVDFYCPSVKLVIELDGSQHYEEDAIEYDRERTAILESMGCHVVRYSNLDIWHNFQGVCLDIDRKVSELLKEKET